MRDEHRQQLVEQYEEAAISLLMDEYAEADGARLLQEYETAVQNACLPEVPSELDEKCRKLIEKSFAKQEHKLRINRVRRFAAKAAVIVFTLLGLSTVTVLSVDALRIPVLNFLMDQSGRYSTVVLDNNIDTEDGATNSTVIQFENNIPDGYEVVQYEFKDTSGIVLCVNEDNYVIYLEVDRTMGGLSVDTENSEYKEQDFCGHSAAFQDKEGYHLRWLDRNSETIYMLFANGLHIDAFWELAYSIAE